MSIIIWKYPVVKVNAGRPAKYPPCGGQKLRVGGAGCVNVRDPYVYEDAQPYTIWGYKPKAGYYRQGWQIRIHYDLRGTMKRYPVPAEEARHEMVVVNSRFIASLAPVFSVEQARRFVQRIRQEYPDASHHVPAYLVGGGDAVIAHCSDDGEPSGTAGRPALAVLSGSGLGDVAVVVTRYFGGTKLGTGGLVRAYSEAVRRVVELVPRAERIATHTVMVALPYRLLERVRQAAGVHHGQVLDETFAADVTLTVLFPQEDLSAFQHALQDLSAGSLQAELIESGERLVRLK